MARTARLFRAKPAMRDVRASPGLPFSDTALSDGHSREPFAILPEGSANGL
jgi:hypothetical protein